MVIKLLIADDHGLVRQSLRQYLEMEGDIEVVGEASGGDEVLDLLNNANIHPDVVVLDTRMPEKDGLETARQIRDLHSDVGVVMLSAYDDPQFVTEALRAGARAYVLKNKDVEYLIDTVRLVAERRILSDPELAPASASDDPSMATPHPRGSRSDSGGGCNPCMAAPRTARAAATTNATACTR